MERGSGAQVVLVTPQGEPIGESEKLAAHEPPGRLHLAFSVFLFDSEGRLLLQRRALSKYHFPGVWANSCCSHPAPGEDPADAAARRVREELGLERPDLVSAGHFIYRAPCARSGLVEHEYDQVYVGRLSGVPQPDPAEVAELRLVDTDKLRSGRFQGELAPWVLDALELAEDRVA